MAAAFVSYIPAFSAPFRIDLQGEWLEDIDKADIMITENFQALNILTNPSEMA